MKPLCGHFNRHWTVVTDANGTVSREYCADCRRCIRVFPGRAAAEQMQQKASRR